MPDKRYVTVCHVGGSTKQVELVDLLPKKKHAAVYWPTAGMMWFNFSTGRALGAPRGRRARGPPGLVRRGRREA